MDNEQYILYKNREIEHFSSEVVALYVCSIKGETMQENDSVLVTIGGIKDDRYRLDESGNAHGTFSGTRIPDIDRSVSIISLPGIIVGNKKLEAQGVEPLNPREIRRNIVVDIKPDTLNSLVGKRFCIGGVEFEGSELCTPCTRPTKLLLRSNEDQKAFQSAFENLGGLRARVIKAGEINKGSKLVI